MKRILSLTRQAIQKYNMINEGDKIAVALSGGKDSFVLFEAMNRLKAFYPVNFELGAIYIDIGFDENNSDTISEYCTQSGITCHIEKSVIKEVVFDKTQTKNPCSLCSRMRRACLCQTAKEHGYNKIALGHNKYDANETLLLNIFYNGKTECFEPRTFYEDIDLEIIRPLIMCDEKIISSAAKRYELPVCKKVCPIDGKTDREKIKNIIADISAINPKISDNIFSAIQKLEFFTSKEDGESK